MSRYQNTKRGTSNDIPEASEEPQGALLDSHSGLILCAHAFIEALPLIARCIFRH